LPFAPILTPWSRTHTGNRFAAFSNNSTLTTPTISTTPSITPTSNISFSLHPHITHHTEDPPSLQPPYNTPTLNTTDLTQPTPNTSHTSNIHNNRHSNTLHIHTLPNTYTTQHRQRRHRKTKTRYQDPLPSPTTPHLMQSNPPPAIPRQQPKGNTNPNQPNFIQTILDHAPSSLDIHHYPQLHDSDIKICTLNVNSLSHNKLDTILTFIRHFRIDIMICIDTRHRDTTCRHYTQRIKEAFPQENTKVLHSPIAPVTTKQHDTHSSVGGQLTILTHKWAGALITHFTNKSKLGLISGLYLTTGLGQLLVMGTYFPITPSLHYADKSLKPARAGGLWERTETYLKQAKYPLTPHNYIHAVINGKSERHLTRSPHNRTILCGDFNIPDYQTGQSTTTGHPHRFSTQTPLPDQYILTTPPFNLQVT